MDFSVVNNSPFILLPSGGSSNILTVDTPNQSKQYIGVNISIFYPPTSVAMTGDIIPILVTVGTDEYLCYPGSNTYIPFDPSININNIQLNCSFLGPNWNGVFGWAVTQRDVPISSPTPIYLNP
jgi:hypothetical protein